VRRTPLLGARYRAAALIGYGSLRDLEPAQLYALWLGPGHEYCRQWLAGRQQAPRCGLGASRDRRRTCRHGLDRARGEGSDVNGAQRGDRLPARARQIGPIGTAARVAGGLGAIAASRQSPGRPGQVEPASRRGAARSDPGQAASCSAGPATSCSREQAVSVRGDEDG